MPEDYITPIVKGITETILHGGGKKLAEMLGSFREHWQPGSAANRSVGLVVPDSSESSETPRFLARQRLYYRIDLANAKWDWLHILSYYHPTQGRIAAIPEERLPKEIGGNFTVADFVNLDLPHEGLTGAQTPSEIRALVLHGRIKTAEVAKTVLAAVDEELSKKSSVLRIPSAPWNDEEVKLGWICLYLEIQGHSFPSDDNFCSYCGFKNLWSMVDTPASGIYPRSAETPNIFAYAAAMEIAWHLSRVSPSHKKLYNDYLSKPNHQLKHQYALRKVACRVIKDVWEIHKTLFKQDKSVDKPLKNKTSPKS